MSNGSEAHDKTAEAAETVQDLKKLSPDERIKRLKELEEARKREIEEAEELIKETVQELEEAEEKKKIPIPEARATDLSTVQTVEGKQLVSTHHFIQAPEGQPSAEPTQPQKAQGKSLEEMAGEENVRQQQAPQNHVAQRPAYSIGAEQQKSAFGEYLSNSQQTVTGGNPAPGSGLEKITEIYKDRAVTGSQDENVQEKYFGTHQQVTGGYESRKREQDDRQQQSDFYRKKTGGPA